MGMVALTFGPPSRMSGELVLLRMRWCEVLDALREESLHRPVSMEIGGPVLPTLTKFVCEDEWKRAAARAAVGLESREAIQ